MVRKKLEKLTFDELVQFITFTTAVYVVYNTIISTAEILEAIVGRIKDTFESPIYPEWQKRLNFILNPLNYLIQEFIIPGIIPPQAPEIPPEDIEITDEIRNQILGFSIVISYLMVYKPEVITGVWDTTVGIATNIGNLVNRLIGG